MGRHAFQFPWARTSAEDTALAILTAVRILQEENRQVTLAALDANIVCNGPSPDQLTSSRLSELTDLGWIWESNVWSLYIGHG